MTDWHIVLSRDGTVLDATDGAPRVWVGARLDDREDVPEDVKLAGREAMERANHDGRPAASGPTGPHAAHVAVVDAVPLRCAPTDVRTLLRSSLEILKHQAEAFDIALRVQVDDTVPSFVSLDRGKIAWAITTLVGNALRYVKHGSQTMPGGSIAVHAVHDPIARAIAISVQDDGPGIPADRLQSLFSGATDAAGLALGLTMVRDVVAAHGGTLKIDSDAVGLSRGTTVSFTLPVAG